MEKSYSTVNTHAMWALILILVAASIASAQISLLPSQAIELEDLIGDTTASGGSAVVQPMAGFGSAWGGDAQIFWRPPSKAGETLLVALMPGLVGTYDLELYYTVAPDYGNFSVLVNAEVAAEDVRGFAPGVELRSVSLGRHVLEAEETQFLFLVEGKDPMSTGYILGLDRIEVKPAGGNPAPAASPGIVLIEPPAAAGVPPQPATPSGPHTDVEPWTTQDIIDEHIDVSAQYALMRMFIGDPFERLDASAILSAVKLRQLSGVYLVDQLAAAQRALRANSTWWTILPAKVDAICLREPADEPPMILLRKNLESHQVDPALRGAWKSCGLMAAPPRPYRQTLPPKQTRQARACQNETSGTATLEVEALSHRKPAPGLKVELFRDGEFAASAEPQPSTVHFQALGAGSYTIMVRDTGGGLTWTTLVVEGSCSYSAYLDVGDIKPPKPTCDKTRLTYELDLCSLGEEKEIDKCITSYANKIRSCGMGSLCDWGETLKHSQCIFAAGERAEDCAAKARQVSGCI